MRRPKRLRSRIAVIVGEVIGERRGGTVADLRVAVEPRQNVARCGPPQSNERREGHASAKREQDDASDADGPGRELPGAGP